MAHWRTMIEKDHLGAWDLVGPDGKTPKDFTLEIVKVESKLLKTREQPDGRRKCVLTLRGARKQFVANTTNCETIESLFGSDTDAWIGKRITLYQTDVRNPNPKKGGKMIRGIRVRTKPATGPAESLPEREVDEGMRSAQDEAFRDDR